MSATTITSPSADAWLITLCNLYTGKQAGLHEFIGGDDSPAAFEASHRKFAEAEPQRAELRCLRLKISETPAHTRAGLAAKWGIFKDCEFQDEELADSLDRDIMAASRAS
jgi:hypothetical protein